MASIGPRNTTAQTNHHMELQVGLAKPHMNNTKKKVAPKLINPAIWIPAILTNSFSPRAFSQSLRDRLNCDSKIRMKNNPTNPGTTM